MKKILNEEIKIRKIKEEEKTPLTYTQFVVKVNNLIENQIAPELRKDNGDIELIDVDKNKIYVKLKGSCKNCPSSNLTLKNFVENVLKEHIGSDIEVIEKEKQE